MDVMKFYIYCLSWIMIVVCALCYQCPSDSGTLRCRDRTLSKTGAIRFAVLISIHNSKSGNCGKISTQGFQAAIALQWITELLNGNGSIGSAYIPGIPLGFDIYDDCGLSSRATNAMLDLLPGGKPDDLLYCAPSNSTPALFAGVLAMTSEEATRSSVNVITANTPFISGNARPPKLESLPNVFYTVPKPDEQIAAILQLIEKFQWYYIAVVYTDEEMSLSLLTILETLKRKTKICIGISRVIKIQGAKTSADITKEVKTLIDDLESEQSKYVRGEQMGVVYIGSSSLANTVIKNIIDEKSKQAKKIQWLMISNVKTDPTFLRTLQDGQATDLTVITVSVHNDRTFGEFKNYYLNVLETGYNNDTYYPWLRKLLQDIYPECAGTLGVTCNRLALEERYFQDENSYSLIVAALTLVSAIKNVHTDKCKSQSGICEDLRKTDLDQDILTSLKSINFSLNATGINSYPKELRDVNIKLENQHFHIEDSSMLNIFKYNRHNAGFDKIGEYKNQQLTIDNQNIFPSICKLKCKVCDVGNEIQFSYIPGDILLLGLFSIRESASDNKFRCGELRNDDQSVVTLLAFLEGIKGLAKINGKRIGGLAIDDCYNTLNITHLLSELFSKRKILHDVSTEEAVDIDKVRLVIGGLSSDVTISVADFFTKLNIPVISYGASSSFLDNRLMFPYFSRTVPSDKLQTNGMVELLKELNFSFVGAIYADGTYGYNGVMEVENKAESSGICVDTLQKVTENFENYRNLEQKLEKNLVKVVVFFGRDTIAKEMLESFTKSFIFIASEAWGRNENLIVSPKGQKCLGSLVFETDTSIYTDKHFLEFLRSITPENVTFPWMDHFWENQFHCSFPWTFNKKYLETTCSMNSKLSKGEAETLYQQQRPIHVSHALQAAWKACNATGLCTAVKTLGKTYAESLTANIRQVRLSTDSGTLFRPFKDNGNGYMGLTIFHVVKNGGSFSYKKVGSYSEENGLQLNKKELKFYDRNSGAEVDSNGVQATCWSNILCGNICHNNSQPLITTPSPTIESQPPVTVGSKDTTITTITIVLAVVVGVVVIAVILLIVLLFRQQKTNQKITRERSANGSHHVSTMNIYDEVRSIQGFSNNALNVPSSSSGIVAGSSAGSSSLVRQDNTPVQYSDIMSSNPDLRNGRIPRRVKSHLSQSLSSLSGSVENSSNATGSLQRRQPQNMQLSMPKSVDKLTYISAEDLGIEDEEVSVPTATYLELSGTESNQSIPLNENTIYQKRNPRYIERSNDNVSINSDQTAAYLMSRPRRPQTLPIMNSLSVQNPPVTNQISLPQTVIQNPNGILPDAHIKPEMYLHPIAASENPTQLTNIHYPPNSLSNSQPQIASGRMIPNTHYLQNPLSNSQPQIPGSRTIPHTHHPQPHSINDRLVHPGSYLQLPVLQNCPNDLYLEPGCHNNAQNIPLHVFPTSSQVPYYPSHFIDENGIISNGQNYFLPTNISQNQIQSPPNAPRVVVSKPDNIQVVHSHLNPIPVNQTISRDNNFVRNQIPGGGVEIGRSPRIINSVGEDILSKIAQMDEEEEVII